MSSVRKSESNEQSLRISKDKSLLDVEMIYNFLTNSYWGEGRSFSQVKRSIKNSTCYGVYLKKKQIGFVRVITDKAVFGYICDVFIIDKQRGKGYSKCLMRSILEDLEMEEVPKWYLITKDAQGLYEQFDFANFNDCSKTIMCTP